MDGCRKLFGVILVPENVIFGEIFGLIFHIQPQSPGITLLKQSLSLWDSNQQHKFELNSNPPVPEVIVCLPAGSATTQRSFISRDQRSPGAPAAGGTTVPRAAWSASCLSGGRSTSAPRRRPRRGTLRARRNHSRCETVLWNPVHTALKSDWFSRNRFLKLHCK